jgi:membrane fusion protein
LADDGSAWGERGLFRREAVQAASSRLGSPIKPIGVASWLLTGFLVLTFVTLVVFLASARYARKETVPGLLEPAGGAARIVASKPGVITAVHVVDGQTVRAGDPIATISMDPMTAGGERLGQALAGASVSQQAALDAGDQAHAASIARQREELRAKRTGLLAEQQHLMIDRDLQKQRIDLLTKSLEAARSLNEQKLFSDLNLRQREDAVMQARLSLSSIERQLDDTAASLVQLSAEDRRLAADGAEARAQTKAARAQLAEKTASYSADREIVLTAPRDGRVTALIAKVGEAVTTSAPLAVILPPGSQLEAVLWAPSRAVGFVRLGDEVRLMYDAFPYQRYGAARGRVVAVAHAPTAVADLPIASETKEALFQVRVTLSSQSVTAYGRSWPLPPGGRLTADLVLEKRSMLDWLLEPLMAIRNRNG